MRGPGHWLTALVALVAMSGLAAAAAPEELLESAKGAFERKDYRTAERLARQAVAAKPKAQVKVDAWLMLIDSLTEQGNLPRAFQECESLLAAEPETKQHSDILARELRIGEGVAQSRARIVFLRVQRTQEGVEMLEKVVAHAPFGPLAPQAVFAIAEAHFRGRDYTAARDQYDRVLKNYPDSDAAGRARLGRALCNYKLTGGPAYDPEPAQEAEKDIAILRRLPGHEDLAARASELLDVRIRGEYEAGLFFFEHLNISGGILYMGSVMANFPDSPYADRARRILESIVAHYYDTPYADQAQQILTTGRVARPQEGGEDKR